MKKTIFAFSIFLISLFVLTGCGKDKGIIGVWNYEGATNTYYTFNEDGTCSYTYGEFSSKCTYIDDKTRVTILYEGNNIATELEYTIKGKVLTITDPYGQETTYKRK